MAFFILFMAEYDFIVCMCVCVCIYICIDIYTYTYYIFFIHSSVDGHLGCFHILAIVNNAALNTGVHVSFQIMIFFRHMPRNGISRSYGRYICSFLRNVYTILHSGTSLHSQQLCVGIPFLYFFLKSQFQFHNL